MPEEGVSDHRHKRMSVKALPGSSLEVVKTKFFFHLLVSLLANPTRLDGGSRPAFTTARLALPTMRWAIRGFIAHNRESGAYTLTDSGRATLTAILADPDIGITA
jgi:hypothetical protein